MFDIHRSTIYHFFIASLVVHLVVAWPLLRDSWFAHPQQMDVQEWPALSIQMVIDERIASTPEKLQEKKQEKLNRNRIPQLAAVKQSTTSSSEEAAAEQAEEWLEQAVDEQPANSTAARATGDLRAQFLHRVIALIEQNKFYPKSARRRGIEADVRVSFRLHGDGSVSDVRLSDAPKILYGATQQAIMAAQPLPALPEEISAPFDISFIVKYQLTE
ncbi:MAG: TonB family protein [Chromatiales bacterium]|nr:TonB family protein [Chromatiales bacterium]